MTMNLYGHGCLVVVIVFAIQGCGEQPGLQQPKKVSPQTTKATAFASLANRTTEQPETRGYRNSVNHLRERSIRVTDDQGKPTVRDPADSATDDKAIADVKLEIVWTQPTQFGWNYSIPELHGGKDLFDTEYPSTPRFLERKLAAKTYLEVSIPDTPYSFYMINGRASEYFYDAEKSVIWRLKSEVLTDLFRQMRSISVSSRRMSFTTPGGDMAEFLVVDFSDRQNSPSVKYYIHYHGP